MHKVSLGILLLALFVANGQADTLTLRDNEEINGKVSYQEGTFTIEARYGSQKKKAKFDRADVSTVEVNTRYANPGEPPSDVSVFADHMPRTRDASGENKDSGKKNEEVKANVSKHRESVDTGHSVLTTNDFNPSTDDVLWLRNNNKVTGHLVSIKDGQLSFEQGKDGRRYSVDEVATILIAPH